MDDSTQKIPPKLVEELEKALQAVSFGSIEIFVQDKIVTQITIRNIKKTSVGISRIRTTKKSSTINGTVNGKSSVRIKL
jgi:hypothetical protein